MHQADSFFIFASSFSCFVWLFYHFAIGCSTNYCATFRLRRVLCAWDKSAHTEIRDFYAHMALTHERHFARCFCRYSGLLFPFSPQEDLQAVQPVQQPPQLLYFPAFLRRIIILTAAAIAPAIRIRSTIEAKFIFSPLLACISVLSCHALHSHLFLHTVHIRCQYRV